MDSKSHARLNQVYWALFCSGFSSIIFQEVWMKKATLLFGHTTYAITAILCVFMFGLAAGNFLISFYLRGEIKTYRAYSIIESLVAVSGFWLCWVEWSEMPLNNFTRTLFVGSMFVPTFFMGTTLPLLVSPHHQISKLYGYNTLGAAMGALLGAFVIIPTFGLVGSAAAATLGLLLAAMFMFPLWTQVQVFPVNQNGLGKSLGLSSSTYMILICAFMSGWNGLSLEIAWTRLLGLIFGPSVYAFGSVLFVYLVGIAVGSWVFSRYQKLTNMSWVGGAFSATSLSIFIGMMVFCLLPYFYLWMAEQVHVHFSGLRVIEIFLSAIILLPMTMLQGFVLPLLVGEFSKNNQSQTFSVSMVFGANTLGCILGALITSLYLVPHFGLWIVLFLVAILAGVLGIGILVQSSQEYIKPSVVISALILTLAYSSGQSWDRSILASGVYKYAVGEVLSGNRSAKLDLGTIEYFKEGLSSTVAVFKTEDDLLLSVDGKVDASMYGDLSTQTLLAALPMSLAKESEKVLVIGLASGVTSGSALLFEESQVTTIEIEPAVIQAQNYFKQINHDPVASPRHRLILDDARGYLHHTADMFDVITSEPSNPWMSGIAPLFTQEFFKLAHRHLNSGGVMCQWLPIYGMTPDLIASVSRTFSSVFQYVYLFESVEGFDLLMIGSKEPLPLNPHAIETRWSEKLKKELDKIHLRRGEDLLGLFLGGPGTIANLSLAPLNTDNGGYLEYRAPKALHLKTAKENHHILLQASDGLLKWLPADLPPASIEAIKKKIHERGDQDILGK